MNDKKCSTCAPSKFANDPAAKAAGISKKDFADAMGWLFASGEICMITEGSPSRSRSKIVEASDRPSNHLPTAFRLLPTHVLPHPPSTPHRWNGAVGLEGPRPFNRGDKRREGAVIDHGTSDDSW